MLCRSASWTTASLTTGPACCSWSGTRARPGPASPSFSGTTSSHTDTTHSLLSGRYVLCCREQCFHCLEIADLATNVLRWVWWCEGIGGVVFTVSAATSCRGAARRGTPSSCATTPAPSPGGDHQIQISRSSHRYLYHLYVDICTASSTRRSPAPPSCTAPTPSTTRSTTPRPAARSMSTCAGSRARRWTPRIFLPSTEIFLFSSSGELVPPAFLLGPAADSEPG